MDDSEVEFTKDGKIISRSGTENYKATDNKLTITNSYGIPLTFDFSIPKKKEMYLDMDMIKFFNSMIEEGDETIGIIKFIAKITFEKQ